MADHTTDAKSIIDYFAQLVTKTQSIPCGFIKAVPNAEVLAELVERLYSPSQYIDTRLIEYRTPRNANCSASAASNTGYLDDQLQMIYHPNPMDIEQQANNTFPLLVRQAWESVEDCVISLEDAKRYYEDPAQLRYLEVEGDVDDVAFRDLITPVTRVAQDLLDRHYDVIQTGSHLRGHFEVRAKYAPADDVSAVDHVIIYVEPKNQQSEVIVIIEDKRASSIRVQEWYKFAMQTHMRPQPVLSGTNFEKMIPQIRKYIYHHRVQYAMLHDHKNPVCMIWNDCERNNRRAANYVHRCHFWTPERNGPQDHYLTARRSLLLLIISSMKHKGIAFI